MIVVLFEKMKMGEMKLMGVTAFLVGVLPLNHVQDPLRCFITI